MQRQHDNDHLAMLAEFMTAMEQPVSQGWEDLEGSILGVNLITEEARESRRCSARPHLER